MINTLEPIGTLPRKTRRNRQMVAGSRNRTSPTATNRLIDESVPFVLADELRASEPTDAERPDRSLVPAPKRDRYTGDSALRLYLQEACEEPLLTVAEEGELAVLIQQGDEAARERMIKANLRLVVKIAREYENLGLPLLDLINEGNIGLMRAVDKFDPTKGAKLSTYGSWWIKQQMRRAITNQAKTIRLPTHAVEKVWQLRKIIARYQETEGRDPSTEELADETGYNRKKIAAMLETSVRPTSLDARIGDESSSERSELIADANAENPLTVLATKNSVGVIRKLLAKLPTRELTILQRRFGLDDGDELTLSEIGAEMGVTRERIRQLQNTALARLRGLMADLDNEPVTEPA